MVNYLFPLLLVLFTTLWSTEPPLRPQQRIKRQYRTDLTRLDSALTHLQHTIETHQPDTVVQQAFNSARLMYKRSEWLTEYYFSVSARQLNGPPVPEGELDDGRGKVIPPAGFQVLEERLFPLDTAYLPTTLHGLTAMQRTVHELIQVAGYNELTNAQLFDALRLSVFRVISLGISGFDSPVAQQSLPEAVATLQVLREAIACYPLAQSNPILAKRLTSAFAKAIFALQGTAFNEFDRLVFIRNQANPLSSLLLDAQLSLHIPFVDTRRLLRTDARSLAAKGIFNSQFFAGYGQPVPTPARVALGKALFADTRLSGNGQRSCASCHQPDRAFTDGLKTPFIHVAGHTMLIRNTPTLINASLQSMQFMDSRALSLEDQIDDVMQNPAEMNSSLPQVVASLNHYPAYVTLFRKAYPVSIATAPATVGGMQLTDWQGITSKTVANALASYIRSLVQTDNTAIDRYVRGEQVQLSTDVKLGFNIFMGKGKCGTCHYYPLFNGTLPPAYTRTESEVLGTPATVDEKQVDADPGRFPVMQLAVHRHAFKIPSLRAISHTAPYMHNGVYTTLMQVVEFYERGGGNGLGFNLPNQTLPATKLSLTDKEKRALVKFMERL